MDIGIQLTPTATAWKTVQRAEELGFSHAWFYDTQLLCTDILVAMSAAAMKTSRIKLCTGVLVPSNRIAPVAANAMASLNALAPGRVIAGVGTGYTARRTMGLKAQKRADIAEYMRVMRALWSGEVVEAEVEGETHKMKFMQPTEGFINLKDPNPRPSYRVRTEGAPTCRRDRRWIYYYVDEPRFAGGVGIGPRPGSPRPAVTQFRSIQAASTSAAYSSPAKLTTRRGRERRPDRCRRSHGIGLLKTATRPTYRRI